MIYTQSVSLGGIKNLAFELNNHYSIALGIICFCALAVLAIIGLCKKSNYLTNLLLWLLMLNINNYLYSTLTAGDYLLNQLLFFNIFFSVKASTNPTLNDLKNALHNMALTGIKLQLCLAYFLTAVFKLTDSSWLDGTAVHQIFRIQEYSNDFLQMLPLWLCMALTYLTLAYQLLFPALIWFRQFKIWLLTFGIVQHLIIAFAMGLFSFGIIMIICYLLFLKYDYSPADHQIAYFHNKS